MNVSQSFAFIHAKCPRCRLGSMFSNNMYGFHFQRMNEYCPVCHYRFEREPGYFYGAMYVSYGMNVIELLFACILTYIITGDLSSFWLYIAVLTVAVLLLAPFNFRYSRVMLLFWLNPGVKYDPKK